ncbi:MAG: IS110 family transposase [Anaerolineae bacterium]
MRTQSSRLDFAGQTVDVGIDVSKRSWRVAVFVAGYEHKVFTQPPSVEPLARYLRRNFPGARYRCVYEAGYFGFWIHDDLREHGIECMVVNPADVPTKDKERRNRNDKVDARKLARGLASGELSPVYVPLREAVEARSLVRARWDIVKKQTRCRSQIRAMLMLYGIFLPEDLIHAHWSRGFLQWLQQVSFDTSSGQHAFELRLQELHSLGTFLAQVTAHIRALSTQQPYTEDVQNLLSIPGVGTLTAMILLTEIVDINRFKNLDHLASYVGLVPGEDSSGDQEHTTGITPRRNRHLRRLLIEASWTAVRKDPALLQSFLQLTRRMSKTRAIVRIARKLLNRIRYVLKNKAPYQTCVVQ